MPHSQWKLRSIASLLFLAVSSCIAQSQATQSAPMAQVAQENAWRAVRADILPQKQGTKPGEDVPVSVVLLNAKGEPTNAIEDTRLSVKAVSPSGTAETIDVQIPSGKSWAATTLKAQEPGLVKLTVSQPDKRVLGSSNYLLVTPEQSTEKKKVPPAAKKKSSKKSPPTTGRRVTPFAQARVRLANAAFYDFQTGDDSASSSRGGASGPHLMLQVSGEHDSNVRADGVSSERVSIYYMDSHPAKSPIKVWLTWDHGDISPNPLVINQGQYAAEARWTSGWPVKSAKVSVASVQPSLPVQGASSAVVNFVEAVEGIAFFNPPGIMSVVDQSDLHARFYDHLGNFIRTSDRRSVSVSASSPIIKFNPNSQDTDWDFSTNLTPTGWGATQIQVATPGYPPFTITLIVTYVGVMLLCIAGGLLGSLGDIFTNREGAKGWKIPARLMVGILAAVLVCWAYVIVGLPQVPAGILHSRIAVLGVSLIGGWGGILGVRVVGKAVGIQI